MKALRRQSRAEADVAIESIAQPVPGPGQVLLQVHYCGVCGSDLHAYMNHPGYESVLPQVTFGHELSATVVETGEEVSNWEPGQRATMIAIQACLRSSCEFCAQGYTQLCPERRVQGLHLDGGMAEFICVNQDYLIPLPEGLDAQAAALTEPLSVADHCVVNCSSIGPDDRVIVTGPGIIGMLSALVARARGAEVMVVGTDADDRVRLPIAREIGFETIVVGGSHPSLKDQLDGRIADAAIEASGAPVALSGLWEVVRPLGTVSVVALYGANADLDMTQFVRKQIDIRTSYGSAKPSYERALEMLRSGQIPVAALVRSYTLEEGVQAFRDALNQDVMKPLLICSDH